MCNPRLFCTAGWKSMAGWLSAGGAGNMQAGRRPVLAAAVSMYFCLLVAARHGKLTTTMSASRHCQATWGHGTAAAAGKGVEFC
jgi:hypothetical protein